MSASLKSPIDKVKNACVECKRRKIRCNGQHPCSSCQWYKHPERCLYTAPQARLSLSRRSLDAVRQRLDESLDVLKRLFPLSTLDELIPLPREKLLDLLNPPLHLQDADSTSNSEPPPSSLVYSASETSEGSQKERVEVLAYAESVGNVGNRVVADEVNALSLRLERPSSHLNASSAMAGLRVLLSIAPESLFASQRGTRGPVMNTVGSNLEPSDLKRDSLPSVSRDTQSLVEAYFARIHPSTPILDEKVFRETVAANLRTDPPWLGLLNMVYALGAIACCTCDSNEDMYYYNKAKTHIGIDSFGSGHMETLQAFTLMSGYYLHYRNRPNMASAIMGAVFRMAYALDLHKELPGPETPQNLPQRELRRRIWWTLVVLDTGETTTLGRIPLMDAFAFEVNTPRNIDDSTGEVTTSPTIYSKLIADIDFSKEVVRIQERLISCQQLEFTETLTLDAHLVYWFQNLPPYLRSPEPCPEWLVQPRASSKWKYLSLRIILHRPVLLEAALRRLALSELTADQRICLSKCQSLARTCIDNIGAEWTQNQYSGWPGGWFLLQACVVPLLSLYTFGEETEQAVGWNQQVQKAILIFEEMTPWGIAARRTYELISALYSKYLERSNASAVDNTIILVQPGSSAIDDQLFGHQQPQQILGDLEEWPLWEGFSTYPDLDVLDIGVDWNGWDFAMETQGWNQN